MVSKDLEESISTPGLGSLPPPNYYKEMHEYTAVIELPHNISDIIGDEALVVDVDLGDENQSKCQVELLVGEPRLEVNNMKMNWSTAEEFCVSKGGHIAPVTSPNHWQKLKGFIASKDLAEQTVWLGGTNHAEEGKWSWTDGSTWCAEKWWPGSPVLGGVNNSCLLSYANHHWRESPCNGKCRSICSLPTITSLKLDNQLVFTSENISTMPAIQVRWVAKPSTEDEEVVVNNEATAAQSKSQFNQIPSF